MEDGPVKVWPVLSRETDRSLDRSVSFSSIRMIEVCFRTTRLANDRDKGNESSPIAYICISGSESSWNQFDALWLSVMRTLLISLSTNRLEDLAAVEPCIPFRLRSSKDANTSIRSPRLTALGVVSTELAPSSPSVAHGGRSKMAEGIPQCSVNSEPDLAKLGWLSDLTKESAPSNELKLVRSSLSTLAKSLTVISDIDLRSASLPPPPTPR